MPPTTPRWWGILDERHAVVFGRAVSCTDPVLVRPNEASESPGSSSSFFRFRSRVYRVGRDLLGYSHRDAQAMASWVETLEGCQSCSMMRAARASGLSDRDRYHMRSTSRAPPRVPLFTRGASGCGSFFPFACWRAPLGTLSAHGPVKNAPLMAWVSGDYPQTEVLYERIEIPVVMQQDVAVRDASCCDDRVHGFANGHAELAQCPEFLAVWIAISWPANSTTVSEVSIFWAA